MLIKPLLLKIPVNYMAIKLGKEVSTSSVPRDYYISLCMPGKVEALTQLPPDASKLPIKEENGSLSRLEGIFLLVNGDFAAAQRLLLRAPESVMRNFFLGCADIGSGKYTDGNSLWQSIISSPLPFSNIGLGLLDDKKLPEALLFYQNAYKFGPNDPSTLVYLNNIYSGLGDLRSALSVIQLAEEIAPDNWVVLMTLAGTQWSAGDKEQAIQTWYRTLRLYPEKGLDVYQNLANALVTTHQDNRRALELLAQALSIWPEDQTIYIQIGDIYFNLGRQDAAAYWRKQAENITRDPQPDQFLNGMISFYTGDIPIACSTFQHILNQYPNHSGAQEWYSKCP